MRKASSVVAALLISVGIGGCQTFYPNPGRLQAWAAAAHAGQFHRTYGRWPADMGELAMFDCPRFDDAVNSDEVFPDSPDMPPIREDVCGFLVGFRYRIAMQPVGRRLEMSFRGADGIEICKLRVDTPVNDKAATLAPAVKLHMTVFSCPGEGSFK